MVGEPFRLGRVVARSFSIWRREFPLLLALALVVHAPRVAATECIELASPAPPHLDSSEPAAPQVEGLDAWLWRAIPVWFAGWLLTRLGSDLSLAFVVFAVYATLRGRTTSFRSSARDGFRRLLPVLLVSLRLFVLTSMVYAALLWALWNLAIAGAGGQALLLGPLAPIFVALLLHPFWLAVPAAAVDARGRPMRASWRLTRGHRLAVCALLLLIYAIDWSSRRLLAVAVQHTDVHGLVLSAIWWTQDLLVVSYSAVLAAVGYHALRLEKEGVDVTELEEVFT